MKLVQLEKFVLSSKLFIHHTKKSIIFNTNFSISILNNNVVPQLTMVLWRGVVTLIHSLLPFSNK